MYSGLQLHDTVVSVFDECLDVILHDLVAIAHS